MPPPSSPSISAFGDGSVAPGETSVTIVGAAFGPFPGSVWLYQNSNRSGAADELTVTAWDSMGATVDVPGSLNNVPGPVFAFVQRSDLAWSLPFSFTLLAAGGIDVSVRFIRSTRRTRSF